MKKTCKNAVSKIISYIAQCGVKTPSPDTGAYCKARKRIREGVFLRLLKHTSQHLHNLDDPTWCGSRVVADGSTITMDDTEENQKEYPQPQSKKEGRGFPMANIVVLFVEPRLMERRPKDYGWLKQPRRQLKEQFISC